MASPRDTAGKTFARLRAGFSNTGWIDTMANFAHPRCQNLFDRTNLEVFQTLKNKRLWKTAVAVMILVVAVGCLGIILRETALKNLDWVARTPVRQENPSLPSSLEQQIKEIMVDVVASEEAQAVFSDVMMEQFRERPEFRNLVIASLAASPDLRECIERQIQESIQSPDTLKHLKDLLMNESTEVVAGLLSSKEVRSYVEGVVRDALKSTQSGQNKK